MIFDTDRLQNDAAYRQDMRHRFLTDHFFAADVLGFKDFSPRAHAPAVNLYFPKNPNIPIREQHRKHKRLHLDPRHTFKTTLKRIDRIQWICAFPEDITILVESATQPLAEASSRKTAMAFYRGKNRPPTVFHLMWPELVTDRYPEGTWNTPNRRETGAGDLDSTLDFTSPKTSQSGWHPILIEPDDVEDANNSGIGVNPDVRQHVTDTCDQNENLLRDGGFMNISGTRYHPFDWYGKCIQRAALNPEAWEILIRPSLIVRSGARLMPGEFPAEDDVELLFPEFANLSYAELQEKFIANYESFMCQQQNDPTGGHVARFDDRLYGAAQTEPKRIPKTGETYICWRPRYGGNKKTAKYSEGAACRIEDGRVYVLDAWQATYTASGEAEKIVAAAREHEVEGVMITAVPGCEYVWTNVRNEMLRRNRSFNLQWIDFDEDDNRRGAAIEQLEPMMRSGRLLFSTAMGKGGECRSQFVFFGLVEQDGIADCIAKFADFVPLTLMRANMEEYELEYARKRRDDALLSQFMHQQGLDVKDEEIRANTEAHLNAMAKTMNINMPPLPGGLDG